MGFEEDLKFISGEDLADACEMELAEKGVEYPARTAMTLSREVVERLCDPLPESGSA